MHQERVTYQEGISCYLEAFRIEIGKTSKYSKFNEGNALIDSSKTALNCKIVLHKALKTKDKNTPPNWKKLSDYCKEQTGRRPKVGVSKDQDSKLVVNIITMPKDYYGDIFHLTEEEYIAISQKFEGAPYNSEHLNSALDKLSNISLTPKQIEMTKIFLTAAVNAWRKNAGIREEDMIYCIIHFDESFPHVHMMAFPTNIISQPGKPDKISFSIQKYYDPKKVYINTMHENVVKIMKEEYGIDASGLINNATQETAFTPQNLDRKQRSDGVINSRVKYSAEDYSKRLAAKEKSLTAKEEYLVQKEDALDELEHTLDAVVQAKAKKAISEIIKNKIIEIFRQIDEYIHYIANGIHQRNLKNKIQSLRLPDNFVVDGYNYGGQTIYDAMHIAEERDLVDVLSKAGYTNFAPEDICQIREALSNGQSLEDIMSDIILSREDD